MSDIAKDRAKSNGKTSAESRPAPTDQLVETQHSITIAGREIAYTVTTGTLILKEEAEKKGEKEGESEGEKPKNVSMGYYEAGHMMYIHQPSLAQLKRDLAAFMRNAMP